MARIDELIPHVTAKAVITLELEELRALDGLIGYGIDAFLEVFYAKLGKVYLQPHEAGLRAFFKTAGQAASVLRAVDDAQRDLDEWRIEKNRRRARAATGEG